MTRTAAGSNTRAMRSRHTMESASHIKMVPTKHGELSAEQFHDLIGRRRRRWWDCFSFGIVQKADSFTFYMSLDHVHADAQFLGGVALMEFHLMYVALVGGNPRRSASRSTSYLDFCVRRREYTGALTWNRRRSGLDRIRRPQRR